MEINEGPSQPRFREAAISVDEKYFIVEKAPEERNIHSNTSSKIF